MDHHHSSSLCIFCCFSFYPSKKGNEEDNEDEKVEQNEALQHIKPSNQSAKFREFVDNLDLEFDPSETSKLGDSVCQDCFKLVRTVINSKRKTDVVEEKVRQMSKEILKAIKELDNCLIRFQNDLRCVEDTVSNSDLDCLQSFIQSGMYSGEVMVLREKIVEAVNDTGAFRNDLQVKVYSELKKLDYCTSINLRKKRMKSQLPADFNDANTRPAPSAPVAMSRQKFLLPKPTPPSPQGSSIPVNNPGQKIIRIIALPKAKGKNDKNNKIPVAAAPTPGRRARPQNIHQEAEYKCRACRRVFGTWALMKEHESSHKQFECSWCRKSFTSSGNCRAHERLHTGERPYKCADCPKGFKQLGGLQYHLKANPSHRPLRDNTEDAQDPGGVIKRRRRKASSTTAASSDYMSFVTAATPIVSRAHGNSFPSLVEEEEEDDEDGSWSNVVSVNPEDVQVNLDDQFEQFDDNSCPSYPVIDYPDDGEDEDPLADIQIQGYSIAQT